MNEALKTFLETRDLDDLLEGRANISELDRENETEILRILKEWTNIQAIANLLMYPNLIPETNRIDYVLKGLRETNFNYLVLASVVGMGELNVESLSPQLITEVINQLIVIAKSDRGLIAERASVFLATRLWHFGANYASQIIELLDRPSDVVRHNTLVALIPLVGLENIRRFINNAVQKGLLSTVAQSYTEQRLATISGFSQNNQVDISKFDLDMLGVPLLSYIPNLSDYAPKIKK
ncbi:hypothetical protein V2H45_21755 [Tumidithrix elongata RA019]|uniref:HEAT repeat domain-containing protein n=1 Tax=Tumidithrix elongata BACA0141 TaxID=2716417 RepID=A0AAW9Q8T1_9CYAN|nr:hypothetical protein [Tumidithrix elongata RA019]